VIKKLDEINKPSKGTELLSRLKDVPKVDKNEKIKPKIQEDPSTKIDEIKSEVISSEIIVKDIGNIDSSIKVEEKTPVKPSITKEEQYKSMISNGVEVVDVKAIEKNKKPKIEGSRVGNRYNLGIPVNKGENRNFDKIG